MLTLPAPRPRDPQILSQQRLQEPRKGQPALHQQRRPCPYPPLDHSLEDLRLWESDLRAYLATAHVYSRNAVLDHVRRMHHDLRPILVALLAGRAALTRR